MDNVYITRIEKFMPNEPVTNDEMEGVLGVIDGRESKSRTLILRSNGIKTRYYALDKQGAVTHTNAQITAEAIRKLFDDKIKLDDIDLITAGTSSPDVVQPAHALMVVGELGGKPIEAVSAQGTCNAGMLSLKYAYLSLKAGEKKRAVVAGSEAFSSWMKADNYELEIDRRKEIEENPYIAFEKDFLRWMLSDGAAALMMQTEPEEGKLALKVEWVDVLTYAVELGACMYAGCEKEKDGSVKGWREMTAEEQQMKSVFTLKQDAKLLQKHIVEKGIEHFKLVIDKYKIDIDSIDYFLPHISSMFFRKPLSDGFKEAGLDIPDEKWFLNLPRVGNVGAASAMLMLEELFNTGKLKKGDKVMLMVPESARFSYAFSLLTVV
jgi:3-oxoacyl-[acyl-carrier-protein] synthase-3